MKADRVDITPVGMLSREALTEENPRLEIIMPLKVVRPPFGMLIAICSALVVFQKGHINYPH